MQDAGFYFIKRRWRLTLTLESGRQKRWAQRERRWPEFFRGQSGFVACWMKNLRILTTCCFWQRCAGTKESARLSTLHLPPPRRKTMEGFWICSTTAIATELERQTSAWNEVCLSLKAAEILVSHNVDLNGFRGQLHDDSLRGWTVANGAQIGPFLMSHTTLATLTLAETGLLHWRWPCHWSSDTSGPDGSWNQVFWNSGSKVGVFFWNF